MKLTSFALAAWLLAPPAATLSAQAIPAQLDQHYPHLGCSGRCRFSQC